MILYNMRERGPYEYDKFVLNILQLYNAINLAEVEELEITESETSTLKLINSKINEYYNSIINTADNIASEYLKYKEEF